MPFEFGDVVLVPFPFTGQTASKQRPAVVVSSRAYGLERPDLMLMAITSRLRPTPALGASGCATGRVRGQRVIE